MLTKDPIEAFPQDHIPHRLILLTTFRDRQPWFEKSRREKLPDGDLLRTAKDSALMAIRILANFLGLSVDKAGKLQARFPPRQPDDVFVTDLGGQRALLADPTTEEQRCLEGLLNRANKELAHLTCNFQGHHDFNTEEAIERGIDVVGRLVRVKVYDVVAGPNGKCTFPDLSRERRIGGTRWELRQGPLPIPSFPRR